MPEIRNFAILSHIDHGKSTLADRFLELTNTIEKRKMREQFLDKMPLEREKGITIKLHPIRMEFEFPISNFQFPKLKYILNMVDTPGHVDFSYEVSRSLAAVEGVVLLVDATQGIQAQTLANLELAKKQNLVIIPVVNKIDVPEAKIEDTALEIASLLKINPEEIIKISAKNGTNVEKVLEAIIEKIPPPPEKNIEKPFRALIFDSNYDNFKGIIAYARVIDGEISQAKKIKLLATNTEAEVKEIGYFISDFFPQKKLKAGEIGYIATGIKEPGKVRVGDTVTKLKIKNEKLKIDEVEMLPGYQEPKPMVFASFYPADSSNFDLLKTALSKLKLNDPAFIFEPETKEALGRGFRCGFLGALHVEIISERLRREFGLDLVISTPSVAYKIIDQKNKENFVYSASDWPNLSQIKTIEEPWFLLEIITPSLYLGKLMEILKETKGKYVDTQYISMERAIIIFEAPLRQIIFNLYDKIKTVSQGYASMNYKILGFRPENLVKMEIWIAGKKEEAFSKIVAEEEAYKEGKFLVKKLKESLPPEQFSVALQAVIGGKVIARETIKARRKDVTGYLYGGDVTRKKKLLTKQKKGKKLLKEKGRVNVPQNVFLEIFKGR